MFADCLARVVNEVSGKEEAARKQEVTALYSPYPVTSTASAPDRTGGGRLSTPVRLRSICTPFGT